MEVKKYLNKKSLEFLKKPIYFVLSAFLLSTFGSGIFLLIVKLLANFNYSNIAEYWNYNFILLFDNILYILVIFYIIIFKEKLNLISIIKIAIYYLIFSTFRLFILSHIISLNNIESYILHVTASSLYLLLAFIFMVIAISIINLITFKKLLIKSVIGLSIITLIIVILNTILSYYYNYNNNVITKKGPPLYYAYSRLSAIDLKDKRILVLPGGTNLEILKPNKRRFYLQKSPLLSPYSCLNPINNGNNILILGNRIVDFNILTNRFYIKASDFKRFHFYSLTVDSSRIFIIGGMDSTEYNAKLNRNCIIYDYTNNSLTLINNDKLINNNLNILKLDQNNILIVGKDFYQIFNIKNKQFTDYQKMKISLEYHSIFKLNSNEILIIYKKNNDNKTHFSILNIKKNILKNILTVESNLYLSQKLLLPNNKILFTGVPFNSNDEKSYRGIYIYNIGSNELNFRGNMLIDRRNHQQVFFKDKNHVLILGGISTKGNFDNRTNVTEILQIK